MKAITLLMLATVLVLMITPGAVAWSNGGYSSDISNPDVGTHDIIAERALSFLPQNESSILVPANLTNAYFLGTELPDNSNKTVGGIGDAATKHHIYFNVEGAVTDDASAKRASEEYNLSVQYLKGGDVYNASLHIGLMTHYISDVGVFGHVMGVGTPWGSENASHHSNYENYMDNHPELFAKAIFDGDLRNVSAYNATVELGYATTFGYTADGFQIMNCMWVDQNYNWANVSYIRSAEDTLNLTTNIVADVLHTLYCEYSSSNVENETTPNLPGAPAITTMPYTDTDEYYAINWTSSDYAEGYNLYENNQSIYNGTNHTMAFAGKADGAYVYNVNAWNANGTSANSTPVTITVYTPVLPSVPTITTAPYTDNDGSYTINWTAAAYADGYILEENNISVYSGVNLTRSFVEKSNGNYSYRARASNANGTSSYSTAVSIAVLANRPPTIKNITVINGNTTTIAYRNEDGTISGTGGIPVNISEVLRIVVGCTDADGDPLTYIYMPTNGTISGNGSTIYWTAPISTETVRITVNVSDGKASDEEDVVIFVNFNIAPHTPGNQTSNDTANQTADNITNQNNTDNQTAENNTAANSTNQTPTNQTQQNNTATNNATSQQPATNQTVGVGDQNQTQNETKTTAKKESQGFVPGFEAILALTAVSIVCMATRRRWR